MRPLPASRSEEGSVDMISFWSGYKGWWVKLCSKVSKFKISKLYKIIFELAPEIKPKPCFYTFEPLLWPTPIEVVCLWPSPGGRTFLYFGLKSGSSRSSSSASFTMGFSRKISKLRQHLSLNKLSSSLFWTLVSGRWQKKKNNGKHSLFKFSNALSFKF